ncbi:MAG: ABC transporter permease [Gammaproteobacteria bacterium]|nr:ABC transporter permease [Gammaproteobacteria bacterium]
MTFNQKLNAFRTILTKEFLRFIRIWVQTVLPPAITTALYFVIFGELIGSQISDIDGYKYMDYIVPGLILMSVITNSYANVVSSFYSAKFQKSIEELLVSPVPNYLILGGYVAGGVARGLIVGLVVTLVAMFFSNFQIHSIGITLLVFLMTAILFSIAGFINAVYANSFDDISIIPTFVLTPLTYLGGIFYSIEMLPAFWQKISLINPILYMINSFRYGLLGISDTDLLTALSIIVIFIVSLFSFALYLLNNGIGIKQ